MWESTVNGRQLHFHLAGINNQNFIMRDEETGSWWQQVTGEAIQGPLKGQRLKQVYHDELTFGLWKHEQPDGRVLRPNEQIANKGEYLPANWEERMQKLRVTTSVDINKSLPPRALVIGIESNNVSKAYPYDQVLGQKLIVDELGGAPLFIVAATDGRSVRAFERIVDGKKLEFFRKSTEDALSMVDAETGTEWDFSGKAIKGPLAGKQLKKIPILNDYWFDWVTYHPNTKVYR